MEKKAFYLYLTTCHTQESHSLNISSSDNLDEIKESIKNIMRAMFANEPLAWWYSEKYIDEKATEMVKPLSGLLDDGSNVAKFKFPFYHLGFILTNYPMWPDNKGGYESDFCL